MIGRKYVFLVTIILMGSSTFLVGVLPTYASWGIAAPAMLIALRVIQGLALGGEYGGAAIYVAEHAPANKRGLHTAWIQTTATLGFLFSIILLGVSVWIRMSLKESPVFIKLKAEGKTSKSPLKDSFSNIRNVRLDKHRCYFEASSRKR